MPQKKVKKVVKVVKEVIEKVLPLEDSEFGVQREIEKAEKENQKLLDLLDKLPAYITMIKEGKNPKTGQPYDPGTILKKDVKMWLDAGYKIK